MLFYSCAYSLDMGRFRRFNHELKVRKDPLKYFKEVSLPHSVMYTRLSMGDGGMNKSNAEWCLSCVKIDTRICPNKYRSYFFNYR